MDQNQPQDFQKQFDAAIADYSTTNKYGVSNIPAHTHNGTDSLHINAINLDVVPTPSSSALLGWDTTDGGVRAIIIGTGLTYTHSTHTLSSSGGTPVVNVYTAGATWTKPGTLKYVIIELVGGGGKGEAASGTPNQGGSGGGGGGYSRRLVVAASLGATETVTVGAGSTGSGGGTSSFGSWCSATGGEDGGHTSSGMGGDGGTGSSGDLNTTGGGGQGGDGSRATGGIGGSSHFGGGGKSANSASSGQAGGSYGGGGAGGTSTGSNANGGNGADGVVIVTEFY